MNELSQTDSVRATRLPGTTATRRDLLLPWKSPLYAALCLVSAVLMLLDVTAVLLALVVPVWLIAASAWPKPRLADVITATRAAFVGLAAILWSYWWAVSAILLLAASFLDVADGSVARKRGEASPRGAMFDMETDALLVLVLCCVVAQQPRFESPVVILGALRYLLVLVRSVTGTQGRPERRSTGGRLAFFSLLVGLHLGLWTHRPWFVLLALPVMGTFARDFWDVAFHWSVNVACNRAAVIRRVNKARDWLQRHGQTAVAAVLLTATNCLLFAPHSLGIGRTLGLEVLPQLFQPVLARGLNPAAWWETLQGLLARRPGDDIARIAGEVALACALIAWWPATRRLLPWLLTPLYVLLLAFRSYDATVYSFFLRPASLVDDWPLRNNLIDFLVGLDGIRQLTLGLLVATATLGTGAMAWLTLRLWGNICAQSSRVRLTLAATATTFAALATASWAVYGPLHDTPVFQFTTSKVAQYVARSRSRQAQIAGRLNEPLWARQAPLMQAAPATKPDVYILLVEAYGAVLGQGAFARPSADLLRQVEATLEPNWRTASMLSEAPVYGGASWMSIATVQSGFFVDHQALYHRLAHDLLEEQRSPRTAGSTQRPHLTAYFRKYGYHTMGLEPGSVPRPNQINEDIFDRHHLLTRPAIPYFGPPYGWGVVPDHVSFTHALQSQILPASPPRMFFAMGVSTHLPWVPPPAMPPGWSPKPVVASLPSHAAAYLRAVVYEWTTLARFLHRLPQSPAGRLVVIAGDHQPAFRDPRTTWATPMHILTDRPELLTSFGRLGASPGLHIAPSGHPDIRHDQIFEHIVGALHRGAPSRS